ncbi:N-acetylmuramoyl-L-alanine amidase [Armatimonas sp.]|uniref:N-acetylmuramoyl-L-alanine amidase n=1 Tax=Armatimonas sp. TaxID=1872638 RepID=UPI00375396A3
MKICIDPGHPSEVGEGARGKKLTEMHAAWLVAKRLEALLKAAGHDVKLTKASEKEFVKNRKRAEIANAFGADLLVRLHCDSEGGTGFWTYFPDRQGTDATGKRGPSTQIITACKQRAPKFHAALAAGLKGALRDNGCLPDIRTAVGSKQGALTGSIWSQVPVVLVEMCVLSNAKDEAFLLSEAGQAQMAKALAAGVRAVE